MIAHILHVDMDAFFVSVERVLDPTLCGKPVIVGADPGGRGVVTAASYEARQYGVHSAMPISQAKRLCPQATFLRGRHEYYGRASRAVMAILERYSPALEQVSIDEAYMDLTGFHRLYGPAFSTALNIKEEILHRLRLPCSMGLATNKLISKVASNCVKPNGVLQILPGQEESFLAPLPIECLPGLGKMTAPRLRSMGVKTLGDLCRIDRKLLEAAFGKMGTSLSLRARGIDHRSVETEEREGKSISRERTFQEDTIDISLLEATLYRLVERASRQLRKEGRKARTVSLKLRYSDFVTLQRSVTPGIPTDLDKVIFSNVLSLFHKVYTRKIRVRLIGISLSNLCPGSKQLSLFAQKEDRLRRLYEAVDTIRKRWEPATLQFGRTVGL